MAKERRCRRRWPSRSPTEIPPRPTLKTIRTTRAGLSRVPSLQDRHADGVRRRPATAGAHVGWRAARRRRRSGRPPFRRARGQAARPCARRSRDRPRPCLRDQCCETLQVGAARQAADPQEAERRAKSPRAGPGSRPRSPLAKPHVIVCLGATAAQALLGRAFKVSQHRGRFVPINARAARDGDRPPLVDSSGAR